MITATPPPVSIERNDAMQRSVLRALIYFDLFKYPLTAEEILLFSDEPGSHVTSVTLALHQLVTDGIVFSDGSFYAVRDSKELFHRRAAGNTEAEQVMPKAYRRSKLIASFPYVRGVYISGSLSKNYFDSTTDMDFFIITEPNRLWICRTMLVLFKKIFLLNSKKYFCVNYFIGSDELHIPDQNVFTATEIATLLPMVNYGLYRKFFEANAWMKFFLPNCEPRIQNGSVSDSSPVMKAFLERMFNGQLGEWLDRFFFRATLKHWKKKFGDQVRHELELNMRSRRSVSKHHPQGFQFQVLRSYEARLREFELQHGFSLSRQPSVSV